MPNFDENTGWLLIRGNQLFYMDSEQTDKSRDVEDFGITSAQKPTVIIRKEWIKQDRSLVINHEAPMPTPLNP